MEELIKRLRYCSNAIFCTGCPYWKGCGGSKENMIKAADAIEELTQKEKFHAFLWNTIQPNEMELYIAMYRARAVPQEPPKEVPTDV